MRRLSLFFLLSLILHSIVLLWLQLPDPDFKLLKPHHSAIEIKLVQDTAVTQLSQTSTPSSKAESPAAAVQPAAPQPTQKIRDTAPARSPSSTQVIATATPDSNDEVIDKSRDPPDQAHFDPAALAQNELAAEAATSSASTATSSPAPVPTTGNGTDTTARPDNLAPPAPFSVKPLTSAKLSMTVLRTEANGKEYRGSASLQWQQQAQRYQLEIEAGIRIIFVRINLYQLRSRGTLGALGIAPVISEETRLRRAPTATHFLYGEQQISFSATDKKIALEAGAQDKASVILQLAAIGNADETQFYPNRQFTLQVAEEKEANLFSFVVVGQEDLDTGLGVQRTWHVVRPPKPGTYSSRLDIWFAPQLGWYPVQISNTETNGTVTVQNVTKITALPDTLPAAP